MVVRRDSCYMNCNRALCSVHLNTGHLYRESNLDMHLQQLWVKRWGLLILPVLLLSLWAGITAQAQTPIPTSTSTSTSSPLQGTVLYNTYLRAGPGTAHSAGDKVRAGQIVNIIATSPDGNWYQVGEGQWIAAFLVRPSETLGTPATPPTARSAAANRLVATATPALSATQPVTVTPPLRYLFATAVPTATHAISATEAVPSVTALRNANLRAGPGTNYAVVGGVRGDETLDLQGRTSDGTWYQLRDGSWIAAFLVGPDVPTLPTVAPTVIAGIPTVAPTTTPTAVPTTPTAEAAPAAQDVPTDTPVAGNEPSSSGNSTFVVTRRRLWNPWENGGSTDGPSVHCGQGRNLTVNVLDENGNRLNGVAVQAEYGAKEVWVTGSQGKGDGVAEFVLGNGQNVKVIRDADGSPVSSEEATGLSTDPRGIDQESLISAGYCQDGASCQTFANNVSCIGHYSWTVTFERRR